MESTKIKKIGGVCALFEATIYIVAFIVYGGVLVYPSVNASASEQLNFLSDNYLILSLLNLMGYVLFGIVLAVLVQAIHQIVKVGSPNLSKLAYVFGLIWVGLVIASGMIANIGLKYVIEMGTNEPENAMLVWSSVGVISEGIGGGNEIVGGVWVLLLSMAALKGDIFSKPLNILGILVGIVGILTIYPLVIFTEIFGIGQIVWFIWIGIYMIAKQTLVLEN